MGTFTVGCRSSRTQLLTGEAVAVATSEAARGLKHRKGLLRKGYDADLIVVDGDLQTDLSALQRVRPVVLGRKSVG
jgi:imidazolonepropionase-like amidohydrolase